MNNPGQQPSAEQPAQQPVVPSSTSTSVPHKSKTPLFILLGIVFLLIAFGGVYLLGAKNTNQQKQTAIVPTTIQKSPTSTTDPTANPDLIGANWKTYTNSAYKINVKYPSDWKAESIMANYISFIPTNYNIPQQTEAQIPGVSFSLLRESYENSIQRLIGAYGTQNQEKISSAGLTGMHIWGTQTSGQAQGLSGGAFVLKNNDGKSYEFGYEVINGKSYVSEARLVMESLKINN